MHALQLRDNNADTLLRLQVAQYAHHQLRRLVGRSGEARAAEEREHNVKPDAERWTCHMSHVTCHMSHVAGGWPTSGGRDKR